MKLWYAEYCHPDRFVSGYEVIIAAATQQAAMDIIKHSFLGCEERFWACVEIDTSKAAVVYRREIK